MGVEEAAVNSIMSGIENTGGVKQHNHKKKLRQRFDIIKKLGQGTFGKVQLGINKETGQEVAIKTIKKSKIESDADLIRIRREIQIMSSVQHPNIIHIYEVFENREKMVLVMEYAAGGELYDYLSERKVLPEDEARRIFRQIATASYYCHKHKICHRDLKLENILLDENNNAKIADFGLSNVFDDQRLLNTFCGSPLYASPEIVKGTPYHGPEVDCWSLGVLLYTLVYGAMPFDGSNFKRLVKQISQGDYYEPSKPSPASPLIRDMLTVNPKKRADIEKICSHWWVNETYNLNCLEVSEELANQTPVRLDVLLSLAPPAPQLESEKLVVTEDVTEEGKSDSGAPVRSQSVGSLMDLTTPERRIMNMINDEKFAPKRKLESTVSTDRLNNVDKRREKIIKENTVADITVHGAIQEDQEDASMNEPAPLIKSLTQTITKAMEVEPEGAACQELLQEAKKSASQSKVKRTQSSAGGKVLEGINEIPSQENLTDKENKTKAEPCKEEPAKKVEEKPGAKKKPVKKKVLGDKNENDKGEKPAEAANKEPPTPQVKENGVQEKPVKKEEKPQETTPKAPAERRKSRIFEAAEKFQNLISPTETKPVPMEKPKKILLPDSMVTQQGVSVDGFKKEFERKSSLTSSAPVKPKSSSVPKRTLIDKQKSEEDKPPEAETKPKVTTKPLSNEPKAKQTEEAESGDVRPEKVKNAVNIISNALDKEGTRKSKSRPTMMRKPPVPFGASGRSASGNIGTIAPLSPPIQTMGPKPFVRPCYENKVAAAEVKQVVDTPVATPEETQTSNAEITLKSATLPRRKTTKAQIQLNYPTPKPAQMEFRTEAAHNVEAAAAPPQVRSEVVVPVGGGSPTSDFSLNRGGDDRSSKERIIPIAFEKKAATENGKADVQSPPAKPPVARPFQTQKSNISQGSNSLSRQSTQDSDSETTSTGEPIKKSAREYIIPIAVEGGGYVTPRAGSVEPSESNASTMTNRSKSKFGRGARRLNSLLSDRDSEDESPFASLHRHSSFGKDSDNEDSGKGNFHHMHRLRRIRPKKAALEHNDSVSSGEEDDDDGFEILTAENLFSTLLSRVRDLTQKLNVDEGVRPGFPSSRLLSQFDRGTNFWNRMDSPLSRHSSLGRTFGMPSSSQSNFNVPWRRSVSKDLASDIETVFNDQNSGTLTARIPRGDNDLDVTDDAENLNLAELDLKKLNLSEEDRLALSSLTPGLSRRIEKQLLAQLTPAEVRKLQRTLSSKTSDEVRNSNKPDSERRKSIERVGCTLPRRSFLPQPGDFNVRSSSIGAQPKSTSKLLPPSSSRIGRSLSVREPTAITHSPESSLSESVDTSRKDSSTSEPLERRTSVRRISRFLRPDFYEPVERENGYIKEKKERERETQQVLKEIRDKRKSRLRSLSRNRGEDKKEEDKHDYVNVPAPIEPPKVVHDYVNVKLASENGTPKKESKISRLVRPKSYPNDQNHKSPSPESPKPKKNLTKKSKEDKNQANKQLNEEDKVQHKNKLLQTLEKKLEKFRGNKEVEESKKSVVDSAIKRLREQSLPRNLPPCTEGGLIKRAVSVEDLPGGAKPLPASRKSVTKILGLFNKKCEDQDKSKKSGKKSPEKNSKKERPKSLLLPTSSTATKESAPDVAKSKLPVTSNFRRSLDLDTKPEETLTKDRSHLRLDLQPVTVELEEAPGSSGLNAEHRHSLATTDDSSTVLSPTDDYLSCDSWSACSDFHHLNDLHSPQSHNGHLYSGDEGESVIDRIRRKSFYTRFNEKKRTRKPSLTYKNSDLYRSDFASREFSKPDYNSLDRYRSPSVTRRTSFTSYMPEVGTSTSRSGSTAKEYRPYTRSASAMLNDYVNVPGGSQSLSHTYQNVPGSHHNLIGSYQNIPGSYQTYSSRIARPTKGLLYTDPDDLTATRRHRSPFASHRTTLERGSISPASEYYTDRTPSSSSFLLQSPTSSEPI